MFQGSLCNPFLQSLQYEVRGTRLTVLLSRSTENLGYRVADGNVEGFPSLLRSLDDCATEVPTNFR